MTEKCHCGHDTVEQELGHIPESMNYSLASSYCTYCAAVRCDAYPGACER